MGGARVLAHTCTDQKRTHEVPNPHHRVAFGWCFARATKKPAVSVPLHGVRVLTGIREMCDARMVRSYQLQRPLIQRVVHLSEEAQGDAEAGGETAIPGQRLRLESCSYEPKHGSHWKPGRGKEGLGGKLEKKQLITFEAT